MEKGHTINFLNNVQDTFPYIESALFKIDNNFDWWKTNAKDLQQHISNISTELIQEPLDIKINFVIYNGPDENVESVTWNAPAVEFTFIEASDKLVRNIAQKLGNTWRGHKLNVKDNKIYIMF